MMILGAILMSICVAAFGFWGGGTPSLLAPTKELVTIGPYRYVRNPIHIGQGIFFIGLGLYLQSPAVLLFSAAWLLFCHLYVVLIEEGSLKKKFGEAYEEYCRAVPRWIPSPRLREKNR
jgi:protein-S-isoprenylcysteine O-methyltransferase Ste14